MEALAQSCRGTPGMSSTAALDCLISVTEKLIFLHSLKPPVIHRDIKPQNVVVDVYGQCRLIDLGISRRFQPDSESDTLISGTRVTAPPEQFGYRQTDERSDLYSCGVLLRYVLTGEYGDKADAELDDDLRRIVSRATRFDPKERYQSAEALLRDLLAARYGIRYRPVMSKKKEAGSRRRCHCAVTGCRFRSFCRPLRRAWSDRPAAEQRIHLPGAPHRGSGARRALQAGGVHYPR